jgi:hypothetical protein
LVFGCGFIMNERITLLALQASDPKTGWLDRQKFAELIVQKCLDQCYSRGMNDALYAGQLQAASYIEEYFDMQEPEE